MELTTYNKKVMLAVIEKFLDNPQLCGNCDNAGFLDACVPRQECPMPKSGYSPNQWEDLLRWHVVALASEFIVDIPVVMRMKFSRSLGTNTPVKLKPGMEFLNWSGQRLYEELYAELKGSVSKEQ